MSNLQRGARRPTPTTTGPVHAVPCPHCGRTNDLRELESQNLLDTGSQLVCAPVDRSQRNTGHCGRMFRVMRIQLVKAVQVARDDSAPREQPPEPQPARTVALQTVRMVRRRR